MKRSAGWIVGFVLVQAALLGGYWLVSRQRGARDGPALGVEPPQRVSMPMPTLTLRRRDGSELPLASTGRRTLIHIWATWCPPCRAELPGLLALPTRRGVDVVAISVDESWDDVDRYLGDLDSSNIVLAAGEAALQSLGVTHLPVTFLLETDGRITRRFDGARDWNDEAFLRAHLPAAADR